MMVGPRTRGGSRSGGWWQIRWRCGGDGAGQRWRRREKVDLVKEYLTRRERVGKTKLPRLFK